MSTIVPFVAPMDTREEIDLSKKVIDKVALIDADRYKHVVTYRIWQRLMDEGERHTQSLINEVIDSYLTADIFGRFDAKAYVFCFSAPSSKVYRNAVAQEKKYKGNRREDPHFYTDKYEDMAYVYQYISQRYPTLFFDDLEADDILSMLQREETFIFSHDKDLKQVPGWHWDMNNYELYRISEEDGFTFLMQQILTGDPTDNISGLRGFGEKSYEKFVTEMNALQSITGEALLHRVMKLYIDKYGFMKGFDTFVEMWTLTSMKINRGEHLRDKYAMGFHLIETLCNVSDTATD